MPGEFIDAPVAVEVLAIALPPCSSVVTDNVSAVHTAYNVMSEEIEKVDATAREVPPHADPAAGCVVHHPPNE